MKSQGACVVDLGAAPGGFSLVAAKRIHLDKAFDKWNIIEDLALRYPPRQISRTLGGSQPQMRFGKVRVAIIISFRVGAVQLARASNKHICAMALPASLLADLCRYSRNGANSRCNVRPW